MLVQQFYSNAKYGNFVHEHFIPMQTISGDEGRDAIEEEYEIGGHPCALIIKSDGSLYDIVTGYQGRDPEIYKGAVEKSLEGSESFATIMAKYQENPADLKIMYALASKYNDMWYAEKAAAMSQGILARSEEAKALDVTFEGNTINLYEIAKYGAGMGDWYARRSPAGLEVFRAEFPNTILKDDVYSDLARFYLRLPPSDEADSFYGDLKEMYADNPSMVNSIVRYYVKTEKNLDEGESFARKLIEMNADNVGYRMNAAHLFLKNNKEDEALKLYGEDFIKGHSDDVRQLVRYAWWWSDKETNLESALVQAKAAVELSPEASQYNMLGRVYRYMKDYENAMQAVEKAIELNPDDEDAKGHLELIKEQMAKG